MSEPARIRRLDVTPQRFPGWIASFAERHGGDLTAEPDGVLFRAADGATATCEVPFPPFAGSTSEPAMLAREIAEHATADRTVGVLLVRLGGYAAGVFTGPGPTLAASRVGSRLVHGRSAAGGQSQQRFARRRENQAHQALGAAADTAVAVFGSYRLDVLVLGGDRRSMARLRDDPRLASYFELDSGQFLTVPDPKLTVLKDTPRLFRAIRITLTEPAMAEPAMAEPEPHIPG
jgi:hypothetical protein